MNETTASFILRQKIIDAFAAALPSVRGVPSVRKAGMEESFHPPFRALRTSGLDGENGCAPPGTRSRYPDGVSDVNSRPGNRGSVPIHILLHLIPHFLDNQWA